MTLDDVLKRADHLLELAKAALANMQDKGFGPSVRSEDFASLRSAALSFIETTYGRDHTYYREFDTKVEDTADFSTRRALGILNAIRNELAGGWIRTTRGLVSAEVFADFLEMSEYLLSENYKDPAAVIVGSVLEEHLRQMAKKYGIAIEELKVGKLVPRKAAVINAELNKADGYNKLDQKSITSWLDLRNKAAHGQYDGYTKAQVELLLASVRDFITRHAI